MPSRVGDSRKRHPIPLRLRNPFVSKEEGGSAGYRGRGWAKARERALQRGGNRSSITGLSDKDARLMVDHIIPYRIYGLTPHTNELSNLRITDDQSNHAVDYAEGFQEKKKRRRLRSF
jgi:hypothetical protein